MSKKLALLLAALVLGNCVEPAAAQSPEGGVLWLEFPGCQVGLPWFDDQGQVAQAVGLPVLAAAEIREVVPAISKNDEATSRVFTCACFAELCKPEVSESPSLTALEGWGDEAACKFCQKCPIGDILGLPWFHSEPTPIDGCGTPMYAIIWNSEEKPPLKFTAGGGVFFGTIVGASGPLGRPSFGQSMVAGGSVWLGCTLENGTAVQAGFSIMGGQQFIEMKR